MTFFRAEPSPFPFRFEKTITDLKPPAVDTDSVTNFWTAYKGAADRHDAILVSKYVGDLDTSLLFVTTPMSRCMLLAPTEFCFCVRRLYSRPSPPRLSFRSFHNFNRIPQTLRIPSCFEYWNRTPRSVGPNRWLPSSISPSALSEPSPFSSLVCPSRYSWPLSRCWGNSGSCIPSHSRPEGISSKGGRVARLNLPHFRGGDCA